MSLTFVWSRSAELEALRAVHERALKEAAEQGTQRLAGAENQRQIGELQLRTQVCLAGLFLRLPCGFVHSLATSRR